jgi:hypothetical protein
VTRPMFMYGAERLGSKQAALCTAFPVTSSAGLIAISGETASWWEPDSATRRGPDSGAAYVYVRKRNDLGTSRPGLTRL